MPLSPLVPPAVAPRYGGAGAGGNVFLGTLTQGGARASLTLGYYLVIPTGFLARRGTRKVSIGRTGRANSQASFTPHPHFPANTILIDVHLQHILRPIRIVLQRRQAFDQSSAGPRPKGREENIGARFPRVAEIGGDGRDASDRWD